MKTNKTVFALGLLAILTINTQLTARAQSTTAFTYQGRLNTPAGPATAVMT
jgi:hypothetical protein